MKKVHVKGKDVKSVKDMGKVKMAAMAPSLKKPTKYGKK